MRTREALTEAEINHRMWRLYDMALAALKRAFTVNFADIREPSEQERTTLIMEAE